MKFNSGTCSNCEKAFQFTGNRKDHIYKHDGKYFCSWRCYLEAEKKREKLYAENKARRFGK